jgi:very-short-patch-repair endonuclease
MSNLELLLLDQLRTAGIEEPKLEHKFHPKRRWRLDMVWPAHMLAVEVEGGTWIGGRHTRGSGFEKDAEKYAEAMCMGWRVLRVTGSQICTGKALKWIQQLRENTYSHVKI